MAEKRRKENLAAFSVQLFLVEAHRASFLLSSRYFLQWRKEGRKEKAKEGQRETR